MLDLKPIIKKVRNLRRSRNMTQQELAGHLGVSLATITRWGRGGWESTPSLAQLVKIAELFDTTVPALLAYGTPGAKPAKAAATTDAPTGPADTPAPTGKPKPEAPAPEPKAEPAPTAPEKGHPWEALGIPRASYYRHKKKGTLEEYLKKHGRGPN